MTVVAQDDWPFPTPIRLTSGRVARAASTYVADLVGLSITWIRGTLNGPSDGATPERADVADDDLSPGRGRLQWDATAVDKSHATAYADVRLRRAVGTVDVTIDADRSLLDISVGFALTRIRNAEDPEDAGAPAVHS